MQQFYLIPLNRVARNIANNLKPNLRKQKAEDQQQKVCTGKLSKIDIDLIRCLLIFNVSAKEISKLFGVRPQTIHSIKSNSIHNKYTSYFQNNNYEVLSHSKNKLKEWCVENYKFIICKTTGLDVVNHNTMSQKLNNLLLSTYY